MLPTELFSLNMRLAFFFYDERVAITDQKRLHNHYDVDDYNLFLGAVSHWYTQLYKSSRLICSGILQLK